MPFRSAQTGCLRSWVDSSRSVGWSLFGLPERRPRRSRAGRNRSGGRGCCDRSLSPSIVGICGEEPTGTISRVWRTPSVARTQAGVTFSASEWNEGGVISRENPAYIFSHEGVWGGSFVLRESGGLEDFLRSSATGWGTVEALPTAEVPAGMEEGIRMVSESRDHSVVLCARRKRVVVCSLGAESLEPLEKWTSGGDSPRREWDSAPDDGAGLRWQVAGRDSIEYRMGLDRLSASAFEGMGPERYALMAIPAFFKSLGKGSGLLWLLPNSLKFEHQQDIPMQSERDAWVPSRSNSQEKRSHETLQ